MKRVLIVVGLLVLAAVLGLWRSQGVVRSGLNRVVNASEDNSPGVTGDETRKTFELKPGDRVEVQGINGRVEIQTSDTKTAEVFVRRTGDNPSSLRRRELIIEQTSDGILVRSKQKHVGLWDHLFGSDPKEEVTIKAPRQIQLAIKGVNGRVSSSDIDGPLEVKGVNGRVELGLVSESAQLSGINGSISVGLKGLGERGARISGINGGIELKLANGLNADLTAKGMNGNVRSEIAEVTVEKDDRWTRYSARIGSGGAPIEISGINGNVRLTRAEAAAPSAASTEKKPAEVEKLDKAKAGMKAAKATQ
jgi:bifunctional DNA-binding transcriptional regulator/antitoxin component of YhaV-PrlF toxin-antitoxin module